MLCDKAHCVTLWLYINSRMKKTALLFFLAIYALLFFLLMPGYKYIIDPDAVGYIKIAERVASADYARSVNGLWSPLNAWLLVPFLKAGMNAVLAARYLTGIFGCGSIIALFFLLNKFTVHKYAHVGIMSAATIVLLHYTFHELFADLLLVMMLLVYLNIVCSRNFINSNFKLILCGLFCAAGFYAKAYFFYFGILHLAVTIFILLKHEQQKFSWLHWLGKFAIPIAVLLVSVIPWAFAMKGKYGKLTISTAGQFNQTWVLSTVYPQPKVLFVTPHYEDSYSFWDDPTYWPAKPVTPFTNKTVFLHQLKLLFGNTQETIGMLNDFSFLSMVVLITALLLLTARNRMMIQNKNNSILFALLLLYPLGYIILHVEPRFLWITNISLIILAGITITILQQTGYLKNKFFAVACIICFGSFCLYPLNQLQNQYGQGKEAYAMAAAFRQQGLTGKFISNSYNNEESGRSLALCYLLKAQDYGSPNGDFTQAEILQGIADNKIDHYIMYYNDPSQKEMILSSETAKNARAVLTDVYPGIIILSFR